MPGHSRPMRRGAVCAAAPAAASAPAARAATRGRRFMPRALPAGVITPGRPANRMLGSCGGRGQGRSMTGEGEVIFEFRRVGAFVKASAIDVASGVEVSITGPASADESTLRRAALAKLEWALRRRRADPNTG